jgi:diguanylate cyclase (GGDEF)-like protein
MNQRITVFFSCNIAVFLVLLLICIGIRYPVLKRFALLEEGIMEQQISRVANGLADELERLDAKARSEATWNDMYNYIVNRNPGFYGDNYTYAGLSPAYIDVLGILDQQGNPLHLDLLDYKKQRLESLIANKSFTFFSRQTLLWLGHINGQSFSVSRNMGLVMTKKGVLLLASRPILSSDGYGPSRGTVIVGRFLNKSVLKKLERDSNLQLSLVKNTDIKQQKLKQPTSQVQNTNNSDYIRQAPQTIQVLNQQSIAGYISLIDPIGVNIHVLSGIAPRLEYAEGERVLNQFTVILFVIGSLLGTIISLLIDNLIQNNQRIQKANQELTRLANLDGLTLLANRRNFENHFQKQWKQAVQGQYSLTLILCDVDYFKAYNDTYGHQAGDDCLRKIAQVIGQTAIDSDDLVARYGGEEFAVILPNKDITLGLVVAEKMLYLVRELQLPHAKSSISPYVSLSIGVASIIPTQETLPESLIEQSDLALYTAKSQGRNQIVCVDFDNQSHKDKA